MEALEAIPSISRVSTLFVAQRFATTDFTLQISKSVVRILGQVCPKLQREVFLQVS